MSEEMEKYGYVPEENDKFDEILKLLSNEDSCSVTEVREELRKDPIYLEHFSTVKQQQYLHIMFDKLELDIREYLKDEFGVKSTKLLFKNEVSAIIDRHKHDYDLSFKDK